MKQEWSAFDTTKGARTIKEIELLSKQPRKTCYSCVSKSIFSSIPIDPLHLFLVIAYLLINLLILELQHQDGVRFYDMIKITQNKTKSW